MNAKQKIHHLKLQEWASRFQDQAESGLTVKAWCEQNGFTLHSYNYWKHILKQEFADTLPHDIVPLQPCGLTAVSEINDNLPVPSLNTTFPSNELRNSRESKYSNSITITFGDIKICAGPSVSDETVLQLLKAVRNA